MTRRTLVSTAIGFLLAVAVLGQAAPDATEPESLLQFKASIHEYVQLHRRIEQQLPPFPAYSDAQDIIESSNAMAAALQTARANAVR